MFLTLTVTTNAWAGAGFWNDGGITLTFTVNSSSVTRTLNVTSQGGETSLGTVTTAITLNSVKANVWKDGSGNICSVNMYYRVKNSSETVVLDKSGTATTLSWNSNDGDNQVWQNTNVGVDLMNGGLAPGTYTFECWFAATGNNSSSSGCGTTFWYSNNNNNYEYTFVIPSRKLTVAGAANGNTVSGTVTGITKGKAYTIKATPTTGYTFSNWAASSGASNITIANTSNASTTVTFKNYSSDATVTASFKPNTYTVQFDGNGSTSGSMSNQSFTYDAAKKLPANAFSKTGYTFAGWATSSGGDAVYADQQSVSNLTNVNNGTVTLYAKWTINQYTVTWVVDKSTTTETVAHGSKVANAPTIDPNNPPCGDKFVGWTTEFYAGKTAPTTLYPTAADIPAVTGDVTYYAVFADYEN